MKLFKTKNNKGFVILFAVTLAAILLSIALGVSSVAQNEIKFGTSARETNDALFAADAGVECALLYDKSAAAQNAFTGTLGSMACAGNSFTPVESPTNFWTFAIASLGSSSESCARVTVDKTAYPVTTIVSKGFNTGNATCTNTPVRQVERELRVSYSLGGGSVNLALASNGGSATASSTHASGNYPVSSAVNGDRTGAGWAAGTGGWNDATSGNYTDDWLKVTFSGQKNINEIDVFTLQDNYNSPSTPTRSMIFSQYGIVDFLVQYCPPATICDNITGAGWQTVPSGTVTGNNLVWRQFNFPSISTNEIRVKINNARNNYSRITEIEAWGN